MVLALDVLIDVLGSCIAHHQVAGSHDVLQVFVVIDNLGHARPTKHFLQNFVLTFHRLQLAAFSIVVTDFDRQLRGVLASLANSVAFVNTG